MSTDVITSAGITTFVEQTAVIKGAEYSTSMEAGWWCGVLASGYVETEQAKLGRGSWTTNTFIHYWSDEPQDTFHRVVKDLPVAAVFIHVAPDTAESLLGDEMALVKQSNNGVRIIRSGRANHAIGQLCCQMLSTNRKRIDRKLFLTGRTHDLINAVLDVEREQQGNDLNQHNTINRLDYLKVLDVVDIINNNLCNPPTQFELAALVGMNTKKLTRCFKAIFNTTMGTYTKEKRLLFGRKMLEEGGYRVSTVAYKLGYSPAHFTTEFHRQFGFSPSMLLTGTASRN
ncbi:MAG: AraC family transcriptional regulator [Pseudomonadota bacterium]